MCSTVISFSSCMLMSNWKHSICFSTLLISQTTLEHLWEDTTKFFCSSTILQYPSIYNIFPLLLFPKCILSFWIKLNSIYHFSVPTDEAPLYFMQSKVFFSDNYWVNVVFLYFLYCATSAQSKSKGPSTKATGTQMMTPFSCKNTQKTFYFCILSLSQLWSSANLSFSLQMKLH